MSKITRRNIVLSFLKVLVWSTVIEICMATNNFTNGYMFLNEEQLMRGRFIDDSRKAKFLSFQTLDNDIEVEMQLSVPFLNIPIKKTLNGASGIFNTLHSANLNLGALGLGAAVVFGSTFVLPAIFHLLSFENIHRRGAFGKFVEDNMNWSDDIEQLLNERGVPPRSCMGRIVCNLVKHSMDATQKGSPTSSDKIIDGLASNKWIAEILQDTVFREAIEYGYSNYNCSSKYPECRMNQKSFFNFIEILAERFLNVQQN